MNDKDNKNNIDLSTEHLDISKLSLSHLSTDHVITNNSNNSISIKPKIISNTPKKVNKTHYVGEFRTEMLSFLSNSLGQSNLSNISMAFGFDFNYMITCFLAFIFPGPLFMFNNLIKMVDGHIHFQNIAYKTAMTLPIILFTFIFSKTFHFSILPSEIIFPASTYLLVVFMHSLRYAFVEIRTTRKIKKQSFELPQTPSNLLQIKNSNIPPSPNACGPTVSSSPATDNWWETEVDTPLEFNIAEEFMYAEQIIPPPSENPIGVRLDSNFRGGSTTSLRHIKKWTRLANLLASPFFIFSFIYRLFWLPNNKPFSLSDDKITADITSFLSSNLSIWIEEYLTDSPRTKWLLSPILSWDWLPWTNLISCNNVAFDSPFGFGSYRLCSYPIGNILGDHPLEFIMWLSIATSMYTLTSILLFYFIECIEIFWMRLKMIRKFNSLTAESLSVNSFDFYSAHGVRSWFAIRCKVLTYYETRFLSLQTSSVFLMIYSAGWAIYLISQNSKGSLYLNDITFLAIMEILMIWIFFFICSQITSQINLLQKEHIELLYRKKQAATASFCGQESRMKNSLIRESYDDIINLIRCTERPAKLFGLSVETKWVDTFAGILSMSVGNILFHLVWKDVNIKLK